LLYVLTAAGVVAAHAYFSYPAMVARGYPPIGLRDFLAPYFAPLAMALPSLFEDGRKRPWLRLCLLIVVSLCFGLAWAMIVSNRRTIPAIGHLAGVTGILFDHPGVLITGTAAYGTVAFAFFFCYDRVMSGCWAFLRQFRDEHPEAGCADPGGRAAGLRGAGGRRRDVFGA